MGLPVEKVAGLRFRDRGASVAAAFRADILLKSCIETHVGFDAATGPLFSTGWAMTGTAAQNLPVTAAHGLVASDCSGMPYSLGRGERGRKNRGQVLGDHGAIEPSGNGSATPSRIERHRCR